jgi:drug/metabolite transporter (DMT)-like permease
MVAALGVIWGSTFMVIELTLEHVTPFWLTAGRIVFAAGVTGALWQLRGRRLHLDKTRSWGGLICVGLLSTAIPFQLISWAQQYVTSSFSGVTMAAVALLVLPLSHFLIPGEKMTWRRSIGFGIGFVGVLVLIGSKALDMTGADLEWPGRIACFAAASCYAISSVVMRRLAPMDPIGLAAVSLLIGSGFVIITAFVIEGPPPAISSTGWSLLIFLGLFPTALANLLRVLVIRTAGPVFMSLTNYQVPLWSVVFGIILLNEPFQIRLLAALLLIIIGVYLSQYKALNRLFFGAKS